MTKAERKAHAEEMLRTWLKPTSFVSVAVLAVSNGGAFRMKVLVSTTYETNGEEWPYILNVSGYVAEYLGLRHNRDHNAVVSYNGPNGLTDALSYALFDNGSLRCNRV